MESGPSSPEPAPVPTSLPGTEAPREERGDVPSWSRGPSLSFRIVGAVDFQSMKLHLSRRGRAEARAAASSAWRRRTQPVTLATDTLGPCSFQCLAAGKSSVLLPFTKQRQRVQMPALGRGTATRGFKV